MERTTNPRVALFSVMLGSLVVHCSAVDPKVGVSQESCGVSPLSTTTNQGSAGYGAAQGGLTPTTCSADAGSACDDCESRWCCKTRLGCYQDPVCACVDRALDACLAAAGNGESAVATCWKSFEKGGSVESARLSCERAWCQQECRVPC